MSGQHTVRRPYRITRTRLYTRMTLTLLLDVAEALWWCVMAALASGLMALVLAVLAFDLARHGNEMAGALIVLWGFREIVGLLLAWASRAVRRR